MPSDPEPASVSTRGTDPEVPVEGGTGRAVVFPDDSTLRNEMAVSGQRLLAAHTWAGPRYPPCTLLPDFVPELVPELLPISHPSLVQPKPGRRQRLGALVSPVGAADGRGFETLVTSAPSTSQLGRHRGAAVRKR
jgi:hypothetical protein